MRLAPFVGMRTLKNQVAIEPRTIPEARASGATRMVLDDPVS